MSDDFSQLKPGDTVMMVGSSMSYERPMRKTVSRVTNTQILVDSRRFRRNDGRMVGGWGFFQPRLIMPTPELLARDDRELLVFGVTSRVGDSQVRQWSDAKLQRVLDAINSEDKP